MTQFSANLTDLDNARLARMVEVGRVLNSTTNLDDLLGFIIREAAALTASESASILLLDPATRQLRFKASAGAHAPQLMDVPVPLDNSIAGAILQADEPMIIDDVTQDERWNPQVSQSITKTNQDVPGDNNDRNVRRTGECWLIARDNQYPALRRNGSGKPQRNTGNGLAIINKGGANMTMSRCCTMCMANKKLLNVSMGERSEMAIKKRPKR